MVFVFLFFKLIHQQRLEATAGNGSSHPSCRELGLACDKPGRGGRK